jgi:hypothetical protein
MQKELSGEEAFDVYKNNKPNKYDEIEITIWNWKKIVAWVETLRTKKEGVNL